MGGAFLAVERAHAGQQAVHLLGDLDQIILAREEGDAPRVGARAVRSTLAGILVRDLDDEGNRVADLQVGQFLAVVPVDFLFTLAIAHGQLAG